MLLHARSMRIIDTSQGLTSQFVMTLCQDREGFVWAGTYSGLNIIAGSRCIPFGMGNAPFQTMGNIINKVENSGNYIWILSNAGLERFDPNTGLMRQYTDVNGYCRLYSSTGGDVVVQTPRGFFYALNQQSQQFERLSGMTALPANTIDVLISPQHDIVVVEKNRQRRGRLLVDADGHVSFKLMRDHRQQQSTIAYADYDGKFVFFITNDGDLLVSSDFQEEPLLQANVKEAIAHRGHISSIVRYHDNIIIGFLNVGAIELHYVGHGQYETRELPIRYGVFDMLTDRRQDILWLATDGGGLIRFVNSPFTMGQIDLWQSPLHVTKPVRALYRDAAGRMWIGTKGDGIITIDHFSPTASPTAIHQFTTANSTLSDNAVYKFVPSRRPLLWIATDGEGVNYYNYRTQSIQHLTIPGLFVRSIMDLLEISPTELWLVSGDGHGIVKLTLDAHSTEPRVVGHQVYFNKPHRKEVLQFYRLARQGDRYIWFCCRNIGLYRYDRHTGKFLLTQPKAAKGTPQQANQQYDPIDISVTTDGRLFCATSRGLYEITLRQGSYQWKKVNVPDLPSSTVFRNVTCQGHRVWACTATVIVSYDSRTGASRIFRRTNGIDIQELNDDAAWCDPHTGYAYFGDIGKVISISPENKGTGHSLHPAIRFIYAINGSEAFGVNLNETPSLVLNHDDNNFTIVYSVPDFVDGENYQYEYRINGGHWISLGNQTSLPLTHLAPGTYHLEMRYHAGTYESKAYKLVFRVRPPWYWSWWMETLYVLLAIAIVVLIVRHYWQHQRQRQRNMRLAIQRKHREDIYESKLQFFATITHELTTPITLMGGSCQRILSSDIGQQVRNYATIIEHNCQRLNDIIQRVMTFRRIESDHLRTKIINFDVTTKLRQTADNFKVQADMQKIKLTVDLDKKVTWPTDDYAFSTIAFNLLSNAFQMSNGRVSLRMRHDADNLRLTFENSGLTLTQNELAQLSDHYKTLETLETHYGKDSNSYLGLAISIGLVKLLKGTISVSNSQDSTIVEVVLPLLPLTEGDDTSAVTFSGKPILSVSATDYNVSSKPIDRNKSTVVIIDDNKEMLWLLSNLLGADYNTRQFSDISQAQSELLDYNPDVIVLNASMKAGNALEACQQLKSGKLTAHIPVIMLSAVNTDEEATQVLQAGAEMFIGLPCDMNYLLSAVKKIIRSNEVLKNYYESPLSGMVRMNKKFVNKEDQKFYNDMLDVIDQNIADQALSTKFIAEKMSMTVRTLYRRLQSFTDEKPVNIIKEKRLEKARLLLVKTNLTVEEICFKAGFTNRGTFYRLFNEKYQCSPKQYQEQMKGQVEE